MYAYSVRQALILYATSHLYFNPRYLNAATRKQRMNGKSKITTQVTILEYNQFIVVLG